MLSEHGCKIAPSTYYAYKKRPPSPRTLRDEQLRELISQLHKDNFSVYGAVKVWHELNRQGHAVARCTVEQLMREMGLRGVRRGRQVRTTEPDPAAERAGDLLERDFVAPAPNRTWVADFTHVVTWSGTVYTAFVVDTYARAVVGWSAAATKQASLVLSALEMALWRRDRAGVPVRAGELVHHSDAGSQLRFKGSSQHRLSAASVGRR
ncbi:hypothetical protein GCM10009799_51960 [Nocardiopsis rhodophaea]|uniref:Integrase catalytic domain-containing protein n=1 Tax=Nocardiopsis rhodophaea TaxID=280238 RepID=A0ABN2TQI2_9ACTN